MNQTGSSSTAAIPRDASTGLLPIVAALAFFSLIVFGYGVFLHGAAPAPAAAVVQGKSAPHAQKGKGRAAPKAVTLKAAAPRANIDRSSLAFPAMLTGGIGLLLSALAGLGLSHSLRRSQPLASRRLLEAEHAARQKQLGDFESQRDALQSQLSEAKQRKAETEALREQVSRQFQEFFRTLPVPCFCFAANGRIIRWNAACEALYGIPAAAALESTLWETIVPASEREEVEAKLSRVLAGESLLAMERWDTVTGGGLCRMRCSMVPLYDAEGAIIGGLSAGVDITEFAQQEEQIAALSTELDGLRAAAEQASAASAASAESAVFATLVDSGHLEISGHPAFRARLTEEIERSARFHAPLSLVLLDLDNFTARNKTFGFEAGDQVLQSAVAMIKSKIRTVDIVARLGADEYAVILPETGEAGARVAADRLRNGLGGTGSGSQPPVTACFGVTQLTPDVSGTEMLVTRALEALENARSCGANTIIHYQDLPESGLVPPAHQAPARQKKLR